MGPRVARLPRGAGPARNGVAQRARRCPFFLCAVTSFCDVKRCPTFRSKGFPVKWGRILLFRKRAHSVGLSWLPARETKEAPDPHTP